MSNVALPPPTGGWNVRDSVADMAPDEAVLLDNWFPDIGRVCVRGGDEDFVATGMGTANVETLFEFNGFGARYFGACTDNKIYEITSGTAVDRTGGATITSDRWQFATMDDAGGTPRRS